ncbi:hypothetical protein A3D85_00720 [Candidatus Amesbacteria bacterium RIFCSPHIGHO2_02_FULL_47_9]|uniref:DUF4870 domain-containing protein n=1 Tax=Candidatus Amesbacteria bacterium RIFCSPHIGHO2_01_FULL_48_32b TaxID=1797253 RepID=A0A1F4YGU0_9BACT|nr:MAG: hypothetical protein A2876_04125 [Candidatus Amesbacteria bacterium RIFCSPHIGHO2_01_FULL_48_32b]OGD02714.1 MAG: hypothetical protein A3D85_00720 [Candidatus Amesbacteria bacterium RIFCSPHIGHO2_02_FULL_47_9]OGD08586.1 MAG: hypothetical protein A2899_02395 [Candidatus Amesbacteria bacterium RIFCSPLOWO2_01_FULL_49_25]
MAEKTTNLSPNLASALCYAPFLGWVASIVFLIVEKNSAVRWNAVQALLLTAVVWVGAIVFGATVILVFLVPLIWIAGFILQLVLTVKAYQGETIKLPVLAQWTDKILLKVGK